jgi:hypothetical protein
MNVAGIVLAREYGKEILKISLDFTVPQYRDFKTGRFIYSDYAKKFAEDGYKKIIIFPENRKFERYLKKMHFKRHDADGKKAYVLELNF